MNLGGSKTFTFDFGFLLGLNCVLDEVKIGKLWRGGAGVGVGDDCVSEADGGVAAGGGGGVVGDSGGVEMIRCYCKEIYWYSSLNYVNVPWTPADAECQNNDKQHLDDLLP